MLLREDGDKMPIMPASRILFLAAYRLLFSYVLSQAYLLQVIASNLWILWSEFMGTATIPVSKESGDAMKAVRKKFYDEMERILETEEFVTFGKS